MSSSFVGPGRGRPRAAHERSLSLIPVPVLVTDAAAHVVLANDAAARLLRRPVEAVLGCVVTDLVDPGDRALVVRLVEEARHDRPARAVVGFLTSGDESVPVRLSGGGSLGRSPQEETWWVLEPVASDERRLHQALTRIGRLASGATGDQDLLQQLCAAAAEATGNDVSLCLGSPAAPSAVATSSQLAGHLDGLQVMAGQGPSLLAHARRKVVSTDAFGADDRWPALTRRAEDAAVVAVPIWSGDEVVGVLTGYSGTSRDQEDALELVAAAAGAMLHERELASAVESLQVQLGQALQSRAVIEQAKGIIMRTRMVGADEAFRHLVSLSNDQNVKLRVVAERIVGSVTAS